MLKISKNLLDDLADCIIFFRHFVNKLIKCERKMFQAVSSLDRKNKCGTSLYLCDRRPIY